METSTWPRRATARARLAAALTLALASLLVVVSSAFAAASYVFEPTLSLTGSCSTSLLDEVPDPGTCPIPPGVLGVDHPSDRFRSPSVTTDSYGDIYVANITEKEGRIDIFGPSGKFLHELKDPAGPQSMAVDSEGNLYVFERIIGAKQIRRFPPTIYKPEKEEIEYASPPTLIADEATKKALPTPLAPYVSLSVDSSDRLYVNESENVFLFDSAKEENKLLEKDILEVREGKTTALAKSTAIAVDSVHRRIYVTDAIPGASTVRVFQLDPLGEPREELGEINGSTTPTGKFVSPEAFISLDIDDVFGHIFVGDIFSTNKVYEFEEDGSYVATIEHGFENVPNAEIAVDDGVNSPHPQKEGWLFVPSVPASSGGGHVYAFEPKEEGPPIIESTSVSGITESDAVLHARINPDGLETTYRLEYVTQQQFEEEEGKSFEEENATVAGDGTLPKGGEGVAVLASALELEPGTQYRYRAFAKNGAVKGEDEEGGSFKTFPGEELVPVCENEDLRAGSSLLLPDCRAYELVTPPDTNGRPPLGVSFTGAYFPMLEASLNGSRASFLIEGGTIPGNEGSGGFNGDLYIAQRGEEGWSSEVAGPSGQEASEPNPGSVSPDQTFALWESKASVYLRHPDGHSELVGQGGLGEDPHVTADLMTEGAGHIIFTGTVQLEPNAPPEGTATVYDRSAGGPTHVVSLLPGDEPQKAGEGAKYLGASEEGDGVAFSVSGTIYIRLHNTETLEVAGPGTEFAGISEGGKRVFYMEGGDLFAFDAAEEEAIPFSESGDVTPVNVASGGTRAYFVSPSVLTGEPNPNGEEAKAGKENLYLSEEGTISFVGIVTARDVEGEKRVDGLVGGLGLWIESIKQRGPAKDPSRTTPSGTTFLFESRADLTDFEGEGFAQVYRYDQTHSRLTCLSCNPTGLPPTSDASLQSIAEQLGSPAPATSSARIPNQSPDGKRAFFQTMERLVPKDTDGKLDVYEWEEDEAGNCRRAGGCLYLISGPHSASDDYLFAMGSSGNDVFFRTSDILLPRDVESTLSIYDARVGGGFQEPEAEIVCEGDGCRPVSPPPSLAVPSTPATGGDGNVAPHCPKGKRAVRRQGRVLCVKKHRKHKHHRRKSGPGRKGASK